MRKKKRPEVGGFVPADGYCSTVRKRRYATPERATEALRIAQARQADVPKHKRRRAEKRVYQCPWCQGWHLTSKTAEPS